MKILLLVAVIAVVSVTLIASGPGFAPFSQQGPKLVGTGGVAGSQGFSVSLSADGSTALVGGPDDNSGAGAAWVWTRSGGVWTQQGSKLVGNGVVGVGAQGNSVSLSADGNTALVGGYSDNGQIGAAWVWTRSVGVWTQQGPKLVGAGAVGSSLQGISVSLSADGTTALVGGMFDDSHIGAAWVWTRNNGVWTQQGAKLVGSGGVGMAQQGYSVSLSADGNTAIIGGIGDNTFVGAAWVWTRTNGVWTQQGAKLVGSGGSEQGSSVSISADGNTALVGGFGGGGGAWIWTRAGGVWTQQGPRLVGSGGVGASSQGSGVSLSAGGSMALVGGYNDNGQIGATWLWTRIDGVWTQQGPKLVGSGAVGSSRQGISVSFSADGKTAFVGGYSDNSFAGAAWVFTAFTPDDFDGDLKTDRTVFRPSNGTWYSALSSGVATSTGWGEPTDLDVAGDYDGDGKADVAVWRPSTGTWFIVQSSNGAVRVETWGTNGDIPLAGRIDGDAKDDLIVWRPSSGSWFVNRSTGGTTLLGWGTSGDQPLLADFDSDGVMDFVVYRPNTGVWYVAKSGGGTSFIGWGTTGDTPVAGDFDGDGKADATVFRSSISTWFVQKSSGGTIVTTWGLSGDIPVSGDWDGDGKSDFTVWRPGSGVWYTQFARGGTAGVWWGLNGDRPIGRQPGS